MARRSAAAASYAFRSRAPSKTDLAPRSSGGAPSCRPSAAHAFGLELYVLNVRTDRDLDGVFTSLTQLLIGRLVISAHGPQRAARGACHAPRRAGRLRVNRVSGNVE